MFNDRTSNVSPFHSYYICASLPHFCPLHWRCIDFVSLFKETVLASNFLNFYFINFYALYCFLSFICFRFLFLFPFLISWAECLAHFTVQPFFFSLCCLGCRVVARSRLTATSTSHVRVILLPQPLLVAGITDMRHHVWLFFCIFSRDRVSLCWPG